MKRVTALALLSVALLLSTQLFRPSFAYACSCAMPVPNGPFVDSAAVFSGKVISDTDRKRSTADGGSYVEHIYLFEVLSAWKGLMSPRVTIYSLSDFVNPQGLSVIGCEGKGFDVGKTYLVYAYRDNAQTPNTGQGRLSSSVNACSRTGLLSLAGEDLKVLGQGQQPLRQAAPPLLGQFFPFDFPAFIIALINWLFDLIRTPGR